MNFLIHVLFFLGWVGSTAFLPSFSSIIPVIWLCIFLLSVFRFASFSWRRRARLLQGLGYGFVAALHYPSFFWKLQPKLTLSPEEKLFLLACSPKITQVTRPSSLLCPFCRVEIEGVLTALPHGNIGVRKRPVLCPRCQTRLDSCRFCVFFEPGKGSPFGGWGEDMTSGRCSLIKKHQAVEDICDPRVAHKLKEMGWHTLYAGLAISDSFSPPEECRSFQFDGRKASLERLPCMGKERFLLLLLEEETYSQPSSGSRSD